jgi:hypothetical protein
MELVLWQDKKGWQKLSWTYEKIKEKAQINKFKDKKENHKAYQWNSETQ